MQIFYYIKYAYRISFKKKIKKIVIIMFCFIWEMDKLNNKYKLEVELFRVLVGENKRM